MVTSKMIPPDVFKARRILSGHKQESLARALNCSTGSIRNFERRRTSRLYSVAWPDLKRELGLEQAA